VRVIKFRAWDKKDARMSSVADISTNRITGKVGAIIQTLEGLDTFRGSEDLELMQYTGMKDKNGVEIYEGDIMRRDGASIFRNTYVVEWVHSMSRCGFNLSSGRTGATQILGSEVIGNIYEKHGASVGKA
jgi:hypothetical protein